MSSQADLLLEAFEALPEDEKRVFVAEVLRRPMPWESGPLDEGELAACADELLSSLS